MSTEPPGPPAPPGPPGPPQQPVYVVQGQSNGMATAALVLGILGTVFGLIPFTFWLGIPLGILGIIFGFLGISRANRMGGDRKGMAVAGLVLGIIGVVAGVLWLVLGVLVANEAGRQLNDEFFSSLFSSTP